jgi:RNA polymerase sigma-70 factor (ECF subfamily)
LLFLQRAVATLGERWQTKGKSRLFAALSPFLYSELDGDRTRRFAAEFTMTEGNVKVTLHRMKEEFRTILRSEVRDIVASDDEVEEELSALLSALR